MSRLGVVALTLVVWAARPAAADVMRLHWRGVAVDGVAPPHLERATESHVAVALKQLGTDLASAPPYDAEGGAHCKFTAGGRTAACLVEVVHSSDGLRAERTAEVPYHDAEDLAESLALLVADMLQTDLHDIAVPAPRPDPVGPPAIGVPANGRASDGEKRRSGKTPSGRSGPGQVGSVGGSLVRPHRPRAPSHFQLELGPSLVVGFGPDPLLGGALVRGLYAQGFLRVGGALSVSGTGLHAGGYALQFVRLATGPRVGFGIARGRIDFDATAGPALLVIATDAHIPDGTHTQLDPALAFGVRLSVTLARPLALVVGADAAVGLYREEVVAGPQTLAAFGLGSLELTLGLAYHR